MEDNFQSRPVKDLVTDTPASFRPEWNTQNVSEKELLSPDAKKDKRLWKANPNIKWKSSIFLEVKTIINSYDQQGLKLLPILDA